MAVEQKANLLGGAKFRTSGHRASFAALNSEVTPCLAGRFPIHVTRFHIYDRPRQCEQEFGHSVAWKVASKLKFIVMIRGIECAIRATQNWDELRAWFHLKWPGFQTSEFRHRPRDILPVIRLHAISRSGRDPRSRPECGFSRAGSRMGTRTEFARCRREI